MANPNRRKVTLQRHTTQTGERLEAWTLDCSAYKSSCVAWVLIPHSLDEDQRNIEEWKFSERLIMRGYFPGIYTTNERKQRERLHNVN